MAEDDPIALKNDLAVYEESLDKLFKKRDYAGCAKLQPRINKLRSLIFRFQQGQLEEKHDASPSVVSLNEKVAELSKENADKTAEIEKLQIQLKTKQIELDVALQQVELLKAEQKIQIPAENKPQQAVDAHFIHRKDNPDNISFASIQAELIPPGAPGAAELMRISPPRGGAPSHGAGPAEAAMPELPIEERACFYNLNRKDAERLLFQNPDKSPIGNYLFRPTTDKREYVDGKPNTNLFVLSFVDQKFKCQHVKVFRDFEKGGYGAKKSDPVYCATTEDFFRKYTKAVRTPVV